MASTEAGGMALSRVTGRAAKTAIKIDATFIVEADTQRVPKRMGKVEGYSRTGNVREKSKKGSV